MINIMNNNQNYNHAIFIFVYTLLERKKKNYAIRLRGSGDMRSDENSVKRKSGEPRTLSLCLEQN